MIRTLMKYHFNVIGKCACLRNAVTVAKVGSIDFCVLTECGGGFWCICLSLCLNDEKNTRFQII